MERKVLTIADLIERADEIKGKKPKTGKVFIEELGGEVVVREIKAQVFDDAMKMDHEEHGSVDGDCHIIAECMTDPDLHNTELLKKYGVPAAIDAVRAIFKPATIRFLSRRIVDFSGYTGGTVGMVDEIKN